MADGLSNILKKLKSSNIVLNQLTAKNLIQTPISSYEMEKNFKYRYSIVENTDETLTIRLVADIIFEPKVLFELNIEYLIQISLNEPLSEAEIISNIDTLLTPVGNEISYLVGFMSDKMLDQPLIIPPTIELVDLEQ